LEGIPVFAKAGSIVPMQSVSSKCEEGVQGINDISNPESLELVVFPGDSGKFVLREDAGKFPESSDFDTAAEQAGLVETTISFDWLVDEARLNILPGTKNLQYLPNYRDWKIILRGVEQTGARVWVDGTEIPCDLSYDDATSSVCVSIQQVQQSSHVEISFSNTEHSGVNMRSQHVRDEVFDILFDAQMPYLTKEKVLTMVETEGVQCLSGLKSLNRGPRRTGDLRWSYLPDSVMAAIQEVMLRSVG
jgi:hypothetical protein